MKVLEGELQQTEDENLKRLRPQRNQNSSIFIFDWTKHGIIQINTSPISPYKFLKYFFFKNYFSGVLLAILNICE